MEFGLPPGSNDICEICGWEDDHVQLSNPFMRGGANKESLFECQQKILKEIPVEVKEFQGQTRVIKWRPLTKSDYIKNQNEPKSGLDYFNAAAQTQALYYWQNEDESPNP